MEGGAKVERRKVKGERKDQLSGMAEGRGGKSIMNLRNWLHKRNGTQDTRLCVELHSKNS